MFGAYLKYLFFWVGNSPFLGCLVAQSFLSLTPSYAVVPAHLSVAFFLQYWYVA